MSSATALGAYRDFFKSFNTRDPQTFSAALNYPHVRVSSRGQPAIVPTLAEHAAGASWDRFLATGWDHTEGHAPQVVHECDDRAHIVGGWTRVDANGGNVLMNRVCYIVTHTPAGWGIQCRFGTDGGSVNESGETDGRHAAAVALVQEYVDAYNNRDWARCASLFVTPHFKIDVGMVREWTRQEELRAAFQDGPWHFVTETSVRAVQGGERSVAVAVDGVLDGGDRAVKGLLFVVNKPGGKDGWGIQARSIIEE